MSAPDDMAAVLAKLQKKFGVTIKEAEVPSDSIVAANADSKNVPAQKPKEAPKATAPKTDAAVGTAKAASDKATKAKAAAGASTRVE